jgi:hypothetical protein
MWVTGGSLHELMVMLRGYRVVLEVHGIGEPFDFWTGGPFSEWLWRRRAGTAHAAGLLRPSTTPPSRARNPW